MLYTHDELKRWWASLSKQAQKDLLATMLDKMTTGNAFALSLMVQYSEGRDFSERQLQAIRKWYRE